MAMHAWSWLPGLLWCLAIGCAHAARIVIAGDSTASEYGPERHPRQGWGKQLSSYLQPELHVINLAVSGRSTRSYVSLGHFATLERTLQHGDLLLIQFGHNDQKVDDPVRYADPDTDFPAGLRRFLKLAADKGATPVLLTPVARRQFDAQGQVLDTHGRWGEAVRGLARAEQVALLDLDQRSRNWLAALGPEASKAWYLHDPAIGLADDTHFHERGAVQLACLVAAGLRELELLRPGQTTRDLDCGVPPDQAARHAAQRHASVIRHADVDTVLQPLGPHGGNGLSMASPLFADQPGLELVVRRRVLTPGAAIGLHAHGKDEIYYVLSGNGELTLDGKAHQLVAGHAVLTRDGSAHSLRQTGSAALVLLIIYGKEAE